MKIAVIGTTSYQSRMKDHVLKLKMEGNEVGLPCFDDGDHIIVKEFGEDNLELGICLYNRDLIKWADEVHLFWDQRSMGTIFDLGMCIALDKPIKAIYIEPKTFKNVILQWEAYSMPKRSVL